MKELIFLRHAKSSWDNNLDDRNRPLSEKGVNRIVNISRVSKKIFTEFMLGIAYLAKNVTSVTIMRKQKREYDRRINEWRRSWLRSLIEVSGITDVHYGVGASRLIDECDGVISMPFTSTAIIAQEKGKPSIYYDPTSMAVSPCDRGIPILRSRDELIQWVQKIFKDSNRGARSNEKA